MLRPFRAPIVLLATCLSALSACSDGTGGGGPMPAEIRLLSDPLPEGTAAWPLAEQVLSVSVGDLEPVTVRATASVFHGRAVAVGDDFACALATGGEAYCWGSNIVGQLG